MCVCVFVNKGENMEVFERVFFYCRLVSDVPYCLRVSCPVVIELKETACHVPLFVVASVILPLSIHYPLETLPRCYWNGIKILENQ